MKPSLPQRAIPRPAVVPKGQHKRAVSVSPENLLEKQILGLCLRPDLMAQIAGQALSAGDSDVQ